MTEVTILAYKGPPAYVSALARMLEREGLWVRYDPPQERRGIDPSLVPDDVIAELIVAGTVAVAHKGIERF